MLRVNNKSRGHFNVCVIRSGSYVDSICVFVFVCLFVFFPSYVRKDCDVPLFNQQDQELITIMNLNFNLKTTSETQITHVNEHVETTLIPTQLKVL